MEGKKGRKQKGMRNFNNELRKRVHVQRNNENDSGWNEEERSTESMLKD